MKSDSGKGAMKGVAQPTGSLTVWLAPVITVMLVAALLIGILFAQQGSAADGITTDSGARFAAVVLGFVLLVPLAIRGVRVRISMTILWIAGALSLLVAGFLWFLVAIGQNSAAWAAYGGLQVLRARMTFADLDWVFQWWACDFCSPDEFLYGPAVAWWRWLTFGIVDRSWVPILGFALAVIMTMTLIAVGRMSGHRGRLAIVAAAFSPAWLLLLDRANIDAFVVLVLVGGAILVGRKNRLWAWTVFALLIWVVGTWKYYPFALGVALLPALSLRRGWLVVSGFLIAALAYTLWYWNALQVSITANERFNVILGDFPAYGRAMLLDRLNAFGVTDATALGWNLLIAVIVVSAFAWGAVWARQLPRVRSSVTSMAAGGSAAFLASTLAGSYGYFYKGAFLIPVVPLLALPVLQRHTNRHHFALFTSIVGLTLFVIALWAAYQSVLSTLTAFLVAGISLGAALMSIWRNIRLDRGSTATATPPPAVSRN